MCSSHNRYLRWSIPLLESRDLCYQTTPSLRCCNLLCQCLPLLPSTTTNPLSAHPFFLPCFTATPLLSISGCSLNLTSTPPVAAPDSFLAVGIRHGTRPLQWLPSAFSPSVSALPEQVHRSVTTATTQSRPSSSVG
ncbi:hypothetical protein B296_00021246 [Ensete ventricosum]|uniref:Uncharacterized protein n=1 Tax=Ensete ventricosum TaxID=4639 RepID=A0A427A828_ENSVE|nr:hypothetical protein B296_00021246 [Ensete ventricosum]